MVVPCGPAVAILEESRIHAEGFRPLDGGAFPITLTGRPDRGLAHPSIPIVPEAY
jgi:hypothetical protein